MDWMTLYDGPGLRYSIPSPPPIRPPRTKAPKRSLPCFEYTVFYSEPRQSSQLSGGTPSPSPGPGSGFEAPGFPAPPAPPPPPPPAPGGNIPAMRISTEIPEGGRGRQPHAPGEPPAAIQNAMMTKDKKPFTYTPGGLDLSQIRSPRIQRRINRNIQDEGVTPQPQQAHQMHQQQQAPPECAPLAVGLPGMVPPPPPPPPPSGQVIPPATYNSYPAAPPPPPQYAPPLGGAQAPVSAAAVQKTAASLRPTGVAPLRREQPQSPPSPPSYQNEPGSLYVAPVGPRAQLGSLYIPPVEAMPVERTPSPSSVTPPPPPQRQFSPQSPQATLNKAPTPWMSQLNQRPVAASPQTPGTPGGARIIPIQIEGREPSQPPATPQTPTSAQDSHLAQWQREQQQRQQQRQQQQQQQQQPFQPNQGVPWRSVQSPKSPPVQQPQFQQQQQFQQPQTPGTRVIPIQIEGASPVQASNGTSSPAAQRQFQMPPQALAQQQQQQFQQQQQQQRRPGPGQGPGPVYVVNKPQQQQFDSGEWGMGPPVQSQSFRVLQKITGTDKDDDGPDGPSSVPRNQQPGRQNDMNAAQLRKLQLSDDDRALMNKFKAQADSASAVNGEATEEAMNPRYRGGNIPSRVFRTLNETVDDEVYLHQEADPRYRGAAIPSRAFRMLQNMTGGDDGMSSAPMPSRISPAVRAAQQAVQESAAQPYVPPSEQSAPEPRKYTGGAIPSRSFRMLQAMTAGSENCAMNPSANGRETPLSVPQQQGFDATGAGYDYSSPSPSPTPPWAFYPPQQNSEQHQQLWDHYNAMCAYMAEMNAALGYPPVPYPGYQYPYDPYWGYHTSDSEDCSGYSSTDEMSYYGARMGGGPHLSHLQYPPDAWNGYYPPTANTPCITVTPTTDSDTPTSDMAECRSPQEDGSQKNEGTMPEMRILTDVAEEDDENDSSDTDTEVEEQDECRRSHVSSGGLKTIRSVTNVLMYSGSGSEAMDSQTSETDEQTEDDYEAEDDGSVQPEPTDETYPHQLSVIFEESEVSDAESVRAANRQVVLSEDGDTSTATADNSEYDSEEDLGDAESSTVMVRLPLKLKFSRSENDEEVTTVIVGDSQVRRTSISTPEHSPKKEKEQPKFTCETEANQDEDDSDADVSVTVTIPSRSNSMCMPADTESRKNSLSEDKCSRPKHLNDSNEHIPKITSSEERPVTRERLDSLSGGESPKIVDASADVSVCIPLFKNRKHSATPSSPIENLSNTSEEEDFKAKSTEESDFHWEDDSSSTSIQTVRGAAEKHSGSEPDAAGTADELDECTHLKQDPEEEEADEVEDFEWGEDGTIRTVKSWKKNSMDEDECPSQDSREDDLVSADASECASEHSDAEESSSASSSDSSSSSSSSSSTTSSSSNSSASSSNGTNRSISSCRSSSAAKSVNVQSHDQESELAEKNIVETDCIGKGDDTCTSQESGDDSEEDGDELECDSKPEEVEQYVRSLIENMKKTPALKSGEEDHIGLSKTGSPDIPDSISHDKSDMSKVESEEDDSGVTSDMSRHISEAENEDNSESHKPRKISKYQRAQTHSRLFRLLQDESISRCENEDNTMNVPGPETLPATVQPEAERVGSLSSRKECLSLPLRTNTISDPDSLSSSSGITSPASPTINDRLVKELVQTLLQRKKGKRLRKLPLAKVHAAALRILQEDMDPYDTLSSTSEEGGSHIFLSPVAGRVHAGSPNEAKTAEDVGTDVYGSNYLDYCQYYESWNNHCGDADMEYDIMPSRAFKLLDQHAQPGGFSPGVIEGLWAKCPRVPSFKSIAPQTETSDENSLEPSSQTSTPQPVASGREDE